MMFILVCCLLTPCSLLLLLRDHMINSLSIDELQEPLQRQVCLLDRATRDGPALRSQPSIQIPHESFHPKKQNCLLVRFPSKGPLRR